MVASTHWLASAAGMAVLERGGNAFDAAVAAGFALQVVEPHMNGPGGDLPLLLWHDGAPQVICGQGPAPAAASIAAYRALGLDLVPGHRAVSRRACRARSTPGCCCCATTGRGSSPTSPRTRSATRATGSRRRRGSCARSRRWSRRGRRRAALWRPVRRARLRNPLLADTYERLARSGGATREARIDAARDAWYRGWVAEAIVAAVAVPAVDSSGAAHAGVLTGDDLAAFSATRRGAGRRCASAAGRCSRPGRGARGRCSCSSSRCSTGSSSARSWASSTSTP